MELTPRPVAEAPRARRPRRRWWAIGLLVAVVAVGGFIVTKFLTESIDYYCNVDEIGQRDGCSADRRIRIQGEVKEGTKVISGGVTTFVMTRNGVDVPVHYDGVPSSEIFQECIDVVVQGQLHDGVFQGDNVEVKHSNDYQADSEAEHEAERSALCSQQRP